MLFLEYPKCSTCKKARAWLEQQHVAFDVRDIVTERPTESELRAWHAKSNLPLRRFFNTNGMRYRELQLSQKLPSMTDDEQFALLASDGMLVKRPLLVTETTVLPGFREAQWRAALEAN